MITSRRLRDWGRQLFGARTRPQAGGARRTIGDHTRRHESRPST
jgi:hypothetical protein